MADRPTASQSGGTTPWWAPVTLSWSFLTVFPAPWIDVNPRAIAAAIALFPLVGAALGAVLGVLGFAFDRVLPPEPTAVLILAADAFLTGGLHLDALMDTADGVFGGSTRAKRLEIMRDSRVGAFGAIAGALALFGEFACLSQLEGQPRLLALIVALAMGRWTMAIAMPVFPAARPTGLGATFHQAAGRWTIAGATLIAAVVAVATRPLGLAAFLGAVVVALLGGRFLSGRLGGLTGDSYGALAVVTEALVLYLAVALWR